MINMGGQRPKIGANWPLTCPYLQRWCGIRGLRVKVAAVSNFEDSSNILFYLFFSLVLLNFLQIRVKIFQALWDTKFLRKHLLKVLCYLSVRIHFFRWGTHLYMSLFPFVHPSVTHHFSGTVHHLTIIFDTHI